MNAGLCDSCRHQKLIHNTRGSTFSLCERSKSDPRYAKYPRLPVERCGGFEPLAERPRRPDVPRRGNKYAWMAGIVALMALGVLAFALTLGGTGSGGDGPPAGSRLDVFAAPSAYGTAGGDAILGRSACELDSEQLVNLCELRRRPLVLTMVLDRDADCTTQVDRAERASGDFPGVNFATVYSTRKERGEVRRLAEARGWRQPVGIDRSGAVARLYEVGGCPTTIFARRGGTVAETRLGNLTEQELKEAVERLR